MPDSSGNEPNLELPRLSLRLGRKKRRDAAEETPETRAETATGAADPAAPRAEASSAESAEATKAVAREPEATPDDPTAGPESTKPEPADSPAAARGTATPAPTRPTISAPATESAGTASPSATTTMEPAATPQPAEPKGPPSRPVLAALVTGVVVGLLAVLLAFGADSGCDAARGTSSCGGGLGLLMLIAIVAICVLAGAALLRMWRLPDPHATSFLGVGVAATVVLVGFLDEVDSPSMLVVIPVLTALTFAIAWWVTMRLIEADQE